MPESSLDSTVALIDRMIAEKESGLRDSVRRQLVEMQQGVSQSTSVNMQPAPTTRGNEAESFDVQPDVEAERLRKELLTSFSLGQSDTAARIPLMYRQAQRLGAEGGVGSRGGVAEGFLDLGREPLTAAKQFGLAAAKGLTGGMVTPPGYREGKNVVAEVAGKLAGELFPMTRAARAVSLGTRAIGLTGTATTGVGKITERAVEDFLTGSILGAASPSEDALSTGAGFAAMGVTGRVLANGLRSAGSNVKHIEDFFQTDKDASELIGALNPVSRVGEALTGAKVYVSAVREMSGRLLGRAQNQISSLPGKSALKSIAEVDYKAESRAAGALEALRNGGLAKLSKEEAENFQAMLTGEVEAVSDNAKNALKAWRGVAMHVSALAKKLGITVRRADGTEVPFHELPNYFPRLLRRDVAAEIGGDVEKLVKEAGVVFNEDGTVKSKLSDAVIQKITDAYHNAGGLSPKTKAAVDHLIAKGYVKSPGQAVAMLERRTYSDLYSPMSNLEFSRSAPLPNEWYESDARKVLPRYVVGSFKRLAEVEQWGQDLSKLRATMKGVSGTEERVIMDMVSAYTGAAGKKSTLSPQTRAVMEDFMAFEVGTKIGLGTAVIPNITQSLISTIPKVGVWRTLRGAASLLTPEARAEVRKTGSTLAEAMQTFSGEDVGGHGIARAFATKSTSIFRAVNKANKYVAAASMKTYVQDLHKLANQSGVRQGWAVAQLAKLGVDPSKRLTAEATRRAMFTFAKDSQLQRDVLKDPSWMSNPSLRFLGLFKRFGIRQAGFIKNEIAAELEQGNVFPILRLVAGGMIGGESVIWARNKIKEAISGRPVYRAEDETWQRVINDLGAVGAMGVISDLVKIEDPETALPDIVQNVGFAATPVWLAEGISLGSAASSYGADVAAGFSSGDAARRQLVRYGGRVGGPLIRAASERFETVRQKHGRLEFDKGEAKKRALAMVRRGNESEALEYVDKWNKSNATRLLESSVWEDRFGTKADRFKVEPLELNFDDIESSEEKRAKKDAVP